MQSIINQLLQLNNKEASIPLPNNLSTLPHILSDVSTADSILNIFINDGLTNEDDPPTVHHTQCSKFWGKWLAAIHKELEALKAKGVYEDVAKLPLNKKAIKCKWVLHIKRDKDSQISYFKAHLVAKGFTQVFGQDITLTFTPIACWDSIQTILCLATLHDYELQHINVKNAYLNVLLHEEIYMASPDGSSAPYW